MPLEYAPYVFISLGLLLQALPLILLLLARADLGLTPLWFGLIALCALLTEPNYDLWLTTVGSGFLLSAAGAIILVSPPTGFARRWVSRLVLAVGASTGMPTLFLTPFFAFRAFRERDRERIVQTGILLFFGGLQAWALFRGGTGSRQYVFSTDGILAAILTNQILLPLIGHNQVVNVESFVGALRGQIMANRMTGVTYFVLIASVGLVATAIYRFVRLAPSRPNASFWSVPRH